jgi:hypothetical protein
MRGLIVVAALAACSSDPPPSCQQAVGNFYSVGCTYLDGSGAPIPVTSAENTCLQIATVVPEQCKDEFNAWLECNAGVMAPVTNATCVSCTQQYMTLIECK